MGVAASPSRAVVACIAGALLGALPALAGPVEPPVYYVRALGEVDPVHTDLACRVVREVFHVRCRVLRPRAVPHEALDVRRQQYDAGRLIDLLFSDLPTDGIGLMAITDHDLFEHRHGRFVFGLASLVDHVGVLSLARYRGTWWGRAPDEEKFRDRYYKVLVHEVAHTLGVGHCPNRSCAMRDDRTLDDLDDSPRGFCKRCQGEARAGLDQRPGTGAWHYLRGHSQLNRGQFVPAVYHFERAVELRPGDPRFHNDLGIAYLRRGDQARALWSFRHAARLDPAFAPARYNQGIVFLGVGDAESARSAFEGALAADADWAAAHRQLGYLYQEVFQDPDRALAHFESYLTASGDDPSAEAAVRDRVRLIKGGGLPRPPR